MAGFYSSLLYWICQAILILYSLILIWDFVAGVMSLWTSLTRVSRGGHRINKFWINKKYLFNNNDEEGC